MSTLFDYKDEAKRNPRVNAKILADTMDIREFLVKSGVVRNASYKIDRPSEQRNEACKFSNEHKIVTRIF